MSKQLSAQLCCPKCNHEFEATLYRSIWIEYPENREMVFNDTINVVTCPECKIKIKVPMSLLCTNVKEHIAVWYEPYPDPAVEEDALLYAKHHGAQSFYATAPRIRDWNAFKDKIIELEQRTGMKPAGELSPEMAHKVQNFVNHLKTSKPVSTPNKSQRSSINRIWIPQIIVMPMLLWSLYPKNPYWFYELLRIVCFVVFGYLCLQASKREKKSWVVILLVMAIAYTPMSGIYLEPHWWIVVDFVTIGIAIASIFSLIAVQISRTEVAFA